MSKSLEKTTTREQNNTTMSIFSFYMKLLKPYKWRYIFGLLGVLINVSDTIIPIFIAKSIDAALGKGPDAKQIILWALIWVIIIALGRTFTFIASRYALIGASRYIGYDLKNLIYSKIVAQSDRFFVSTSTGEIMNRATSDIQSVMMFLGMGSNLMPNAVLRTILAAVLMFTISWKLALPVLAFVPVLFLIEYLFGKREYKLYKIVQDYSDKVVARIQENFSGSRTVRSYNQEASEKRLFADMTEKYVQKMKPLNIMDALFFPVVYIISWVPLLIILWYGGTLYMAKEITIGGLSAFIAYIFMLIWPIISLGWVVNLFQRSNASLRRIAEVTEAKPDIQNPANPYKPKTIEGDIEFSGISLSYGTKISYIDDISLKIPKGQVVGIVGPVGSGKSSLGKILLRVWDPDKGSIKVDGVDVRKWDLKTLRKSIGYVPQDSFLFSTSVEENISFAKPDATTEEVKKVADMVQIKNEVDRFPKGFDTIVGERGVTLSGGQKQRVAIGRALLLDPPILLLDDPLSSVDTSTEDAIIDTLEPIIKGRTTIIIAHRVSAMRLANRIIVMDHGKIVEDGAHDELMAKGGYYANLVERQRLATEIGEKGALDA